MVDVPSESCLSLVKGLRPYLPLEGRPVICDFSTK